MDIHFDTLAEILKSKGLSIDVILNQIKPAIDDYVERYKYEGIFSNEDVSYCIWDISYWQAFENDEKFGDYEDYEVVISEKDCQKVLARVFDCMDLGDGVSWESLEDSVKYLKENGEITFEIRKKGG